MLFPVLNPEIQLFIDQNVGTDLTQLALRKNPFPDFDWIAIINQVAAKTKAKDKLPTWFSASNIVFPSKISVEQTSSERTALYKSQLVKGDSLIDLTGGFGVDDYYFAKLMKNVVHCEINPDLSAIVKHNFEQLHSHNAECISGDSAAILKELDRQFAWIYIDPSRRNDAKGKVFLLKDCLPDVPNLLDFYFKYSNNVMIKTAPILDIAAGLAELKNVREIHIVAVENEVKELLWIMEKEFKGLVSIKCVNILKVSTEEFNFNLGAVSDSVFSLPKKFIFEPNAAIMKSGGFDAVGAHFGLSKLHQHSHLYTSDEPIDFPGRIFEVGHNIGYNKTEMKMYLENRKANITTRNFPDSVELIRKKWKIKDGGNQYCFFTTDANNHKIVLICAKIK